MAIRNVMRMKEIRPNQPQRNAGSRPSSGDSSAFETSSSLGPRGRSRSLPTKSLMKKSILILVALTSALLGATVHSAPAGSVVTPRDEKVAFEKHRDEHHKWKKGDPAPESYVDAGLLSDVALVWSGRSLDGGTVGYLFKDSTGALLAVCSGPGLQTKDHPRRIDAPIGSRLFVGGLHYTDASVEIVPASSKAETWLRSLIREKKG
jgi:hypothetical protein